MLKIGDAILHFKGDTTDLDKKTSALTSKLGSFAKGMGIGLTSAITAGTTALVGFGKQAVSSYASLEQNIGGVQTLFKDSADAVIKNANRAYKTAGMSANQYMETVTSFSASLLQSLSGDTEEATKYADQAITDMSDNANKMGTDISLIQSAYQGFAKQNYTMLDNLKLGYGGTKTEMERLIADANKIKEANGEMADLSIESFADITEAIHIIQDEMKITGTTEKEAEGTIIGSLNAMKGAFDNFLNGSGSPKELADSILTAFGNISNAFLDLLPGLIDGLVSLINGLIPEIPNIINRILPALIKGAVELVKGLAQALPQLIDAILKGAIQIITALAEALPDMLPQIIDAILGIIPVLIDNLPLFIEAGVKLIIGLAVGLVKAIPTLLERGWEIIGKIIGIFKELPGMLWNIGVDLIKGLWNGIKSVGDWLWSKITGFFNGIVGGIKKFFGIKSPSKLFANEIGQWLPKGMAVGITANVDSVTGAVDEMNKEVLMKGQMDFVDSMYNMQPNLSGQMTSTYSPNVIVNVQNDMEIDPLGQVVNKVKTFSGGAKNDYNWGAGL